MRLVLIVSVALTLLFTGCSSSNSTSPSPTQPTQPVPPSTVAIKGTVKDGQTPLVGAHVYLFAAGTTGYGDPSTSLLDAASTGTSDSVGAYVVADSTGTFSIPSFTCQATSQLYLYTREGNAGAGNNAAAGLMTALGPCPSTGSFLTTPPTVSVNEVTTVAAAFALAGFATDATHISSAGTTLAQTGLANAFLNAANLASVATGQALATIPAGTARAPQATVNTLANILAACVSSSGPSSGPCSSLFSHALANGTTGLAPADTADVAIHIAHFPGLNVPVLYGLIAQNPPFTPSLSGMPGDFALGLFFTQVDSPGRIAIDAAGAIWVTSSNSVIKLSSSGKLLSGAAGFTAEGMKNPTSIALDADGNVWIAGGSPTAVVKFSNSGSVLSGTSGFTTGNAGTPVRIAVDSDGNAWITTEGNSIVKFSSSGSILSGPSGFTAPGLTRPWALAIDPVGNVWVTTLSGNNAIFELSSSGAFLSGANGYPVNGIANSSSLALDSAGNVWAASLFFLAVEVSSSGTPLLTPSGDGSQDIAIDGAGNVWATVETDTVVHGVSNSGAPLSGTFGYNAGILTDPLFLALDGSGDIWVANGNLEGTGYGLSEIIGAAVPVVTPIAAGLKNNTLGPRP